MTRIIRENEARRRSTLSHTTRWRKERARTFPKRKKLSANSSGYDEEEFEIWLSDPENYEAPDLEQGGQR